MRASIKKGAPFLPGSVSIECAQTIKKAQKTDNPSWNQHVGVETQPGEIKTNFDPEIILNVVQRLVFVKVVKASPVIV